MAHSLLSAMANAGEVSWLLTWKVAKFDGDMSYLIGTIDMCLCYDGANGNGLHGYSDSSMGENTEDCHSTSGYVFLLANSAIS